MSDMTIDEAIEKYRDIANPHGNCWVYCRHKFCSECEYEHNQLAKWLEELKEYKKKPEGWMWDKAEQKGYNKAIDDFAERLCYKIKSEIDDCADEIDWIEEIAEKLKAGGENDKNRAM